MANHVFECNSCLVVFASIGARSSWGLTNVADQVSAHNSKT